MRKKNIKYDYRFKTKYIYYINKYTCIILNIKAKGSTDWFPEGKNGLLYVRNTSSDSEKLKKGWAKACKISANKHSGAFMLISDTMNSQQSASNKKATWKPCQYNPQ